MLGTTFIFWSCPKLTLYWREISKAMGEMFGRDIAQDPMVMMLGVVPEGIESRAEKYLFHILLTAALKCITIRWMKPNPPTYNMWKEKIGEIYQMERITYSLRLQSDIFIKRWTPATPLLGMVGLFPGLSI